MKASIQPLLGELKAGLTLLYGPRLAGIYLFGSYARGEERSHSDLDLLIVLDSITSYSSEVELTGFLISQLSLKYQITINRVFVSEQEWRAGEGPFLDSARQEAILA